MKRPLIFGYGMAVATILILGLARQVGAAQSLDIIPAVGNHGHWHITHTTQTLEGPSVTTNDVRIRRTGDLDATLERDNSTLRLNVLPDGSLQTNEALTNPELANFLAILNAAHSITSAAGSGAPSGWTAMVVVPQSGATQSDATPAPLLSVPIHATINGATLAFNGETETTVTSSGSDTPNNNGGGHRGGGRYGGFPSGGLGGGFGHGGGGNTDQSSAHHGTPATLKLQFSGSVVGGAVAKLSITETRAIEVDSRQYISTENWTIVSTP